MNNTYDADVLRELFKESLDHLGLRLTHAKDWINSRLVDVEYSYEQLYRFSKIGLAKGYSRKTLDKAMIQNLAQIEFWWNKRFSRPYTEEEIFDLIGVAQKEEPPDYNEEPQLSLLELAEVEELKKRVERLSPVGRTALLAPVTAEIATSRDRLSESLIAIEGKTVESEEKLFYRLRNWLRESLNILGRPGQPRTAAQERGYKGRLGENLNLLFEGDRQVSLSREDYIALSYILIQVEGWSNLQPILKAGTSTYEGDWQGVMLDLRRCGHPASF